MQKVRGSLGARLANMEMWPQPENIILQLLLNLFFFNFVSTILSEKYRQNQAQVSFAGLPIRQ